MLLQRHVVVQTPGFIRKVRIENALYVFISRNAYAFGNAYQKKNVFFKQPFVGVRPRKYSSR